MERAKKHLSREVGLEIGSICGKYFLKLEDLHYGYWTDGLEVDISNLHIAQENYSKFLISHIPEAVKTILDVGCGTGGLARRLVEMGYEVDGVSPSPFFAAQGRDLLGGQTNIFECRYEELQTQKRYDLALFSESFQYLGMETALEKTCRFLNPGGYMLICDVFSKDIEGKGLQRGGHKLSKFRQVMTKYPFEPVEDLDITEETAPTIDIMGDVLRNVGEPIFHLGLRFLADRYPVAFKFLRWKYGKQVNKMREKYFNGDRTGETFKNFKSYRLVLCRKASSSNSPVGG
ncbi:MAG TPA: class I SAM-dependent methyltransferase [Sedimentisphaerales bacterium]|nr:class I SAM-dependent methyltransferase [Sedimentisphaerales bacterium]